MKIRRLWVIKTICLVGFWFLRALLATVHCKYWRSGRDFRPAILRTEERYIYALWHEYLVVPIVYFNHPSCRLLISQHADGEITAEITKHLRMGVVRGSSTRGGVEAIRQLLRPGRYRCVAVTPDGPRGPRRHVQPGIIYLASKLGWPIVAVGFGYRNPWRLGSWDRLAIPKPYQPAAAVTSELLVVPANLDRNGIELYRQKLEDSLHALTAKAEWAAANERNPFNGLQPVEFPSQAAA
jgi:lysophospholipid acyltransferase (LPLAT)-like uncharacterized protein